MFSVNLAPGITLLGARIRQTEQSMGTVTGSGTRTFSVPINLDYAIDLIRVADAFPAEPERLDDSSRGNPHATGASSKSPLT